MIASNGGKSDPHLHMPARTAHGSWIATVQEGNKMLVSRSVFAGWGLTSLAVVTVLAGFAAAAGQTATEPLAARSATRRVGLCRELTYWFTTRTPASIRGPSLRTKPASTRCY